jgi:prophage antirepressor-like protein
VPLYFGEQQLNIVPFAFEHHQIRVLADDNGEPLFVAKDVATALGYIDQPNAIKQHCKGVAEYHPPPDQGRDSKCPRYPRTGFIPAHS